MDRANDADTSRKLVEVNTTGVEQKMMAGSIEPSNTSRRDEHQEGWPGDDAACDEASNAIDGAGTQLPRLDANTGDMPSLPLEHSDEYFIPKPKMKREKTSKEMFDAISGIVQGDDDDDDGDVEGQLLAHLAAALSTTEPAPGSEYAAYVVGEEDHDEQPPLLARKVSVAALIGSMESLSNHKDRDSDEESNVDLQ